jgi:anti-sigma regulatory factor (Ser/Thr protein kinase)
MTSIRSGPVFLSIFSQNQIHGDIISRIELSVYEVLINIVDHGSEAYRTSPISLQCSLSDSAIQLVIEYPGDEYDITAAGLPEIESHAAAGKRRGLGLYIIRTLMDSVEYSFADGLSRVVLEVRR